MRHAHTRLVLALLNRCFATLASHDLSRELLIAFFRTFQAIKTFSAKLLITLTKQFLIVCLCHGEAGCYSFETPTPRIYQHPSFKVLMWRSCASFLRRKNEV